VNFLTEHRQELDALARAVMKRETLSAGEITEVLEEARSRETA
jgi:cell division protease FtsH